MALSTDHLVLAQVTTDEKQPEARFSALEGAFINEPAEALAVPLLEKDVGDLADREKQNAVAIRSQDDRLDRLVNQIFYITFGIIGFVAAAATFVTIETRNRPLKVHLRERTLREGGWMKHEHRHPAPAPRSGDLRATQGAVRIAFCRYLT